MHGTAVTKIKMDVQGVRWRPLVGVMWLRIGTGGGGL
jgi:hypothetical protein